MGMFDGVNASTKALLTGQALLSGLGHNSYHLSGSGCNSLIDIQDFHGSERFSELFFYPIRFTSTEANITPQDVMNCSVKFFFQNPTNLEPY